jgi:hypothetical protein
LPANIALHCGRQLANKQGTLLEFKLINGFSDSTPPPGSHSKARLLKQAVFDNSFFSIFTKM